MKEQIKVIDEVKRILITNYSSLRRGKLLLRKYYARFKSVTITIK